jgi:hypothetical protein
MKLYRWSPKRQELLIYTLEEWLDTEEHERSSLVLFSSAEIGKSKVSHLIAQESRGPWVRLARNALTMHTMHTMLPRRTLGVW